MNRNKIVDKVIEFAIGLALTSTVAVLSGIRKDLNELNSTMISVVDKLASYEQSFLEAKASLKDLENRVRILEIQFSSHQRELKND